MAVETFRRSLKKHQEAAAALAAAAVVAVDGTLAAQGELAEPQQQPPPTDLPTRPHDKDPSHTISLTQDTRSAEHTGATDSVRSDSSTTTVAKQDSVLFRVFRGQSLPGIQGSELFNKNSK